jgi:histone H3/H4
MPSTSSKQLGLVLPTSRVRNFLKETLPGNRNISRSSVAYITCIVEQVMLEVIAHGSELRDNGAKRVMGRHIRDFINGHCKSPEGRQLSGLFEDGVVQVRHAKRKTSHISSTSSKERKKLPQAASGPVSMEAELSMKRDNDFDF